DAVDGARTGLAAGGRLPRRPGVGRGDRCPKIAIRRFVLSEPPLPLSSPVRAECRRCALGLPDESLVAGVSLGSPPVLAKRRAALRRGTWRIGGRSSTGCCSNGRHEQTAECEDGHGRAVAHLSSASCTFVERFLHLRELDERLCDLPLVLIRRQRSPLILEHVDALLEPLLACKQGAFRGSRRRAALRGARGALLRCRRPEPNEREIRDQ